MVSNSLRLARFTQTNLHESLKSFLDNQLIVIIISISISNCFCSLPIHHRHTVIIIIIIIIIIICSCIVCIDQLFNNVSFYVPSRHHSLYRHHVHPHACCHCFSNGWSVHLRLCRRGMAWSFEGSVHYIHEDWARLTSINCFPTIPLISTARLS